jgi:hypothetical protein
LLQKQSSKVISLITKEILNSIQILKCSDVLDDEASVQKLCQSYINTLPSSGISSKKEKNDVKDYPKVDYSKIPLRLGYKKKNLTAPTVDTEDLLSQTVFENYEPIETFINSNPSREVYTNVQDLANITEACSATASYYLMKANASADKAGLALWTGWLFYVDGYCTHLLGILNAVGAFPPTTVLDLQNACAAYINSL